MPKTQPALDTYSLFAIKNGALFDSHVYNQSRPIKNRLLKYWVNFWADPELNDFWLVMATKSLL